MLLSEERRRGKYRDLAAAEGSLTGCSDRYLCLAESNVSHNQPVHWNRPFHVILNITDGLYLVVGLSIDETILQFLHQFPVGRER